MKNNLLLISFLVFSSINIIYSQGGETVTSATSSPITLPFSGSGTTVGKVDNYDPFTALGSGATSGPDWLYYFCATSTAQITANITFTPDPINGIYPSITVWDGNPNSSNLIAYTSPYGISATSAGTFFTPIVGQCYYVMIDNMPTPNGFPYGITIGPDPTPPALTTQPSCTNMGFETGNFTGWSGSWSNNVTTSSVGSLTPDFVPVFFNTTSSQHTIMSGAGVDPNAGFPVVCPGQGTYSMRLGDGLIGENGGATISQKFSVTTSNALFTYNYAVVVQDGSASGGQPHDGTNQPYFKVEILNSSGIPIPCGQFFVTGGPGIPDFTQIGASGTYYRDWTAVFVDLSAYVGSAVTVKYTVNDCALGAHACYAYIDASCSAMVVPNTTNICPTKSGVLTSPLTGIAYSWSVVGNATVIGTNQSITVSPLVNTTYQCIITNAAGCNTTLTFPVVIYPPSTVTSTSETICLGGGAALVASGSSAPSGTYSWSPSGGSNATSTSLSPATTTTYTVTYTDANGCVSTGTGTVTVNPLPVAPPTSPVTYCQNQTPNSLTTSVTVTAGCTLNWYTAPTGGTASSTAPTVSTATPSTTTYYVSQTLTATGCEGPRSPLIVTVNPLPTVIVNSPSTCAGIAVTLTASGADTYTWSTTPVQTGSSISVSPLVPTSYTVTGTSTLNCSNSATSNVSINGSLSLSVNSETICEGSSTVLTAVGATDYSWDTGETTASITVSPTSNASYSVTGTTGGCTGTVTSNVTVDPMPSITVNSPTVCNGTAASLIATPTIGGGSYSWSPVNPATQTISVTPASTTPYTVTYTLNSCQTTGTGTVTVNPVPTVTVNSQTICIGDPVTTLTATPSIGGGTYLWNPSNLTTSFISFSPLTTTPYTVTYTLNNCSNTGTGTITVNPLPVVDAGPNQTVCVNSAVVLNATGASTYFWNNGVANGIAFTPSGTNTYTVTGTSAAGCIATDNVTVNVEQLPIVSFAISDTFGCAPLNVTFTNTTTGVDNCIWRLSDGTVLNGCSSVTNLFTQAGCFDITLITTSPNGCTDSLTDFSAVCVEANPIADFIASPTSMPNYNTLSNMTNNSVGAISYNWNFGDGATSTDVNPSHVFPMTEGDYLITLIAHSEHCYDTAFMSVNVFEETIFYVPNTFTPDGDDFNEMFRPVFSSGFDPNDFTLYIFDRWGELIFESHNVEIGWRGTYGADNIIVQDGTYTWKIIYKHKTDKKKNVVVGHVNVLK